MSPPLSAALCRLLLELLELLFDKFNAVAAAHSVVLGHLQHIVAASGGSQEGIKLYEQADVSAKIQTVLQVCDQSALHPASLLSKASIMITQSFNAG